MAMNALKKMRILLLAYQCNPKNTSEPRVSYEWVRHLQELVDLTVMTHERNRNAIEKDGRIKCRMIYIPIEHISRPIWKINTLLFGSTQVQAKMFLGFLDYFSYEVMAYRKLPPKEVKLQFDLVHRVSPKCFWWPTLSVPHDIPFILGPVNSGMSWPPNLCSSYASSFEKYFERCRSFFGVGALGRVRKTQRILIANRTCLNALPSRIRCQCDIMPETAIEPDEWVNQRSACQTEPLKLLFVGRLIPLKGVDLILFSLASCSDINVELSVVGEGPLKKQLLRISDQLGLSRRVHFLGQLDRQKVAQVYEQSDIFVFPSLRESGGNVIYEAMAAGLPVIAVDHGGPAELLSPDCGFLISPQSTEYIIKQLALKIRLLALNRDLCSKMGRAAITHVLANHTWDARCRDMLEFYNSLIAQVSQSNLKK